jgi:hypothetical protein
VLLFWHWLQLAAPGREVSRFRKMPVLSVSGYALSAIALLRHKVAIIRHGRVRPLRISFPALLAGHLLFGNSRNYTMRKIVLAAAIAGAALSLAACSNKTEDATGEAMDSAMADASANADAAGDAVSTAAADATAAASEAVDTAAATAETAADKAEAATDKAAAAAK